MNPEFWAGKKVLLTGHTGFKGSWLSLWLQQLGSRLTGYADAVPTNPSLFETADVGAGMVSVSGDVRDLDALTAAMREANPEIVIHMAAQSLVRRSYADPVETFSTNILGTVNVLEAVRAADDVRVVVIVTSDKCYDNHERREGYREDEPMGGYDPYSSSKGCAELVTASYRNSYFNVADFGHHGTAVASVRAGNVIGGGDWSEDRLIPDVMAFLQNGEAPVIRNPGGVRPWQFVMDPLDGYLLLAEHLYRDGPQYAGPWNFGPDGADARDVEYVVAQLAERWGGGLGWQQDERAQPHEVRFLSLDSGKARSRLSWSPKIDLDTSLDWIVDWYRAFGGEGEPRNITIAQIQRFQDLAAAT